MRIKDNFTIWSFGLTDNEAGGTILTQRREAPDGISSMSRKLTDGLLGGVADFQIEPRTVMRETLAKIKADSEG